MRLIIIVIIIIIVILITIHIIISGIFIGKDVDITITLNWLLLCHIIWLITASYLLSHIT